jgi:hypothetical protein
VREEKIRLRTKRIARAQPIHDFTERLCFEQRGLGFDPKFAADHGQDLNIRDRSPRRDAVASVRILQCAGRNVQNIFDGGPEGGTSHDNLAKVMTQARQESYQ